MEPIDAGRILVLDDFLTDYDPLREADTSEPNFIARTSNYRAEGILGDNTNIQTCPRFGDVIANIPRACRLMGLPPLKSVATMVYVASKIGDPFKRNIHRDDTSSYHWGYTFSYHWLGLEGSGGTVWYSDMQGKNEIHRVDFRPNRLVAFPAIYPHTGWANADQPNRSQRIILATFVVLDPRLRSG